MDCGEMRREGPRRLTHTEAPAFLKCENDDLRIFRGHSTRLDGGVASIDSSVDAVLSMPSRGCRTGVQEVPQSHLSDRAGPG